MAEGRNALNNYNLNLNLSEFQRNLLEKVLSEALIATNNSAEIAALSSVLGDVQNSQPSVPETTKQLAPNGPYGEMSQTAFLNHLFDIDVK